MRSKRLKLIIIYCIAFTSCSLNYDITLEIQEPFNQKRVVKDEIPDIISKINNTLSGDAKTKRLSIKIGNSIADLDIVWSKIIELTDSTGRKSYTFPLIDSLDAPYKFHNLIVTKEKDGTIFDPYILTYEMSDKFRVTYDQTGSIHHFEGKVIKKNLSLSDLNSDGYSTVSMATTTNNNDPCPNDTMVDGDNSGESSGGGPGGGGAGGSGYDPEGSEPQLDAQIKCYSYWYYPPDPKPTTDGISPVVIGSEPVLRWRCDYISGSVAANSDPCQEDILVAVVDPTQKRPCNGDPVNNPQVAPTSKGKKGGLNGWTRYDGKRYHDGIDIKSNIGNTVYPMHSGKIIGKRNTFRPGQYAESSYGNYVIIESVGANGEVFYLRYNHLRAVTDLEIGDHVPLGMPIGTSGITGSAADPEMEIIPHIHILARKMVNGQWQKANPADYMYTVVYSDGETFTPYPCQNW